MNYWLMKTEPDVFSYDDLVKCKKSTDSWDGIRNYQARNFMRDDFKLGDGVLIYHSRTETPSIIGIAKVTREAYPDDTALDSESKYFDPKSDKLGESRWCMVDVTAVNKFANPVSLKTCKEQKGLEDMLLIRKGQRLSIQPVKKKEWDIVCKMGENSN